MKNYIGIFLYYLFCNIRSIFIYLHEYNVYLYGVHNENGIYIDGMQCQDDNKKKMKKKICINR